MYERFEEALEHSDVALDLASELEDDALVADVLMTRLSAETLLGRPSAATTAQRALALQNSGSDARLLDQPLVSVVEYWTWVDLQEQARTSLVALVQRAQELGDENARPWLLCLLGDAERALGDLPHALGHAREGREAAEQSGQPLFEVLNLALESVVHAQAGHADEARQTAGAALGRVPERHAGLTAAAALGHLELTLGAAGEAAAILGPQVDFVRQEGLLEPGATTFVVDHVEALTELGRRDDACELLDWYEGNAQRLERVSALDIPYVDNRRLRDQLAAAQSDKIFLRMLPGALTVHAFVDLLRERRHHRASR